MTSAPLGIRILAKIFNFNYINSRRLLNQIVVLLLTFTAYASLHACRKALPVVKNKLQGECRGPSEYCYDGFEPFDAPERGMYFALLDMFWAFSYAFGMLIMGYFAEKSSRKMFLAFSLCGTGLCVCSFGLGYFIEIHNFWYYAFLQVLNGFVQSAGWPTIIPIVSSWVPKRTMGSILGIWGNHYAVGNIIGQTIAAIFVDSQWGMSFIVNGLLCFVSFILVVLFLASKPKAMGFEEDDQLQTRGVYQSKEKAFEIAERSNDMEPLIDLHRPIGFSEALFLPGVLEYAFSLFFCKVVIYTFLFWLPYYINATGIRGYEMSPTTAGLLATLFDLGGIIGNIITGFLLDLTMTGGTLCFILQILSSVTLFAFAHYGSVNYYICIFLLMLSGFFVNSPNSLITGSISASLGEHPLLRGNKRATSTISAIIDGVGCLGAAVAPLIVSQLSAYGWNYVMYSLIVSCILSGILLIRLVIEELSIKS